MAHGEHAQAAQFFGGVEDDGRESRRHLRVESYFNARLNFILALDLRTVSRKFKVNFNTLSQTNKSSISCVLTTASRKYVMSPIKAVFHLLAIFVNVVEPDDISTCLTLFSKVRSDCSSTCARRVSKKEPRGRHAPSGRPGPSSPWSPRSGGSRRRLYA